MPDWTKPMQQSFEYYEVDPGTWRDTKKLTTVKSCTITRDLETDTLGSATIDVTEMLGECYVRVYLITVQNGVTEKHPLGTFLVQTPSTTFDGKIRSGTLDAYTPLLELKENPPPLGYSLLENEKIMTTAYRLTREHVRAPVVETETADTLNYDFVANTDDTWLTFVRDLISNAKHSFALDELGRILFAPNQEIESLQPVWTYDDGNSSILYPDISMKHDLYGIPNVLEIVFSKGFLDEETGETLYQYKIVNDDSNSPVSTVRRGREIIYREVDPSIAGDADTIVTTKRAVENYAKSLMRALSSLEWTVSYSHGYCPVRLSDCVRLDCEKAGLDNIKAKVISQTIKCKTSCQVSETAVFTMKLWG